MKRAKQRIFVHNARPVPHYASSLAAVVAYKENKISFDALFNAVEADRVRRAKNNLNRWDIVVTDTFGGELNFCWRDDYHIELPKGASDRSVVIAAKKAAGYTGVKCDTEHYGDSFRLNVRGACVAICIELHDW